MDLLTANQRPVLESRDLLSANQRPVLPGVCEGPVLEVQALEQGLAVPLGSLRRAVPVNLVLYIFLQR